MAGAVFGEVQVALFVAGAIFREIWNDISEREMLYFFNANCSW